MAYHHSCYMYNRNMQPVLMYLYQDEHILAMLRLWHVGHDIELEISSSKPALHASYDGLQVS